MTFFNKTLFLLIICFTISAIILTLSHELSHCFMAKYLGYETKLTSISCLYRNRLITKPINSRITIIKDIKKNTTEEQTDRIKIVMAGPIQTMLTGSIGFIFLLLYKNRFKIKDELKISVWILIFVSLFWLRQPINLLRSIIAYALDTKEYSPNDEFNISRYFDFNLWTIHIITAIIGTLVFLFIFNKIIPKYQKITFIIAGLIGFLTYYLLWVKLLGQIIFK